MRKDAVREAWTAARPVVGWVLLVLFILMVLLWTAFGFEPQLVDAVPGPLDEFGRVSAFWPILAGFAAGGGAAWALAPGLRLQAEKARSGEEGGVRLSPLAAALLGPASLLMMFSAYWPCAGVEQPFWSALRHALEALEGYVAEPFGGNIEGCPAEFPQGLMAGVLFGRVTLLLVLGIGLAYVFRHSIDSLRARAASQVIVFAGLADETMGVARMVRRNLTRRERLVLLAGSDEIERARALAREVHALVHPMDVSEETDVRAFVRARGSRGIQGICLMSDDSATNLRAMEAFMAATGDLGFEGGTASTREVPNRVLVRVDNPWHAEDWRRRQMTSRPGWLFDAVSVHEMAARHAVDQLKKQTPAVDTVVIAGSSPFDLAVLSELSFEHRIDAYLDSVSSLAQSRWDAAKEGRAFRPWVRRTPRAVLVGDGANVTAGHFRERLAQFGVPNSHLLVDVREREHYEDVMASLVEQGRNPALVTNDMLDEDATFLAVRHPRWTIFAWDDAVIGVTEQPLIGGLHLVGATLEPIADFGLDIWDRLGSVQHQTYLLNYLGGATDDDDQNGKRGRWQSLSPFAKESNIRSFAAFTRNVTSLPRPRKLATSMGSDGSGESPAPLSEGELERLAVLEHESWVRHHVEHGYKWGPERKGRQHPDIRPWDDLDELEKAKDVTNVQATNAMLVALGFVLTDAGAASVADPLPDVAVAGD